MPICPDCKSQFEITDEDSIFCQKFDLKPPVICNRCGQRNRLSFRNERNLYRRKCDLSRQEIISIYSPDKPYKVYKSDYWFSDQWNPLEYGREFDFSKPFFEQLAELQLRVPRLGLTNIKPENSDYCNSCIGNKNSYLIFGGDFNEDCLYGTLCMRNKNSLDIDLSNDSAFCYMVSDCFNCYECQYAMDCKNCNDCAYISDCTSCSECILCTNLTNVSYHINNQPYSKEEYLEKKKKLLTNNYQDRTKLFTEFLDMRRNRIVKYAHTVSCQDCSGDYLKNSKNCTDCFDTTDSEDLRDIIFATKCKDCRYSSMLGINSELVYNACSTLGAYNIYHSFFVLESSNVGYSDLILNSQNCFGCAGLQKQEYCLLNKKYNKTEYEELLNQVILHMKKSNEWGQAMPKSLSCLGYNETTAHDYFPMTKEEVLNLGFKWSDYESPAPQVDKIIPAGSELPWQFTQNENIPDDILNYAIECEVTGKTFRINKSELKFYQDYSLPIPRRHPDQRHKDRSDMRNPRQLWHRKCNNPGCNNEFETTYAPDRSEKVYCEECYLKTVY
ncbi:MAG: hypothetical protein NTZ80_02875 [Patescibacteria group bacterium]|nr:hypothetical protein [Patescibacteria group bacterium]